MNFDKYPMEANSLDKAIEMLKDDATPMEQKKELMKAIILTTEKEEMKKEFLESVITATEKEIMIKMLKDRNKEQRNKFIQFRLKDLLFEKEILEAQIKAVRQYMD